MPPLRAVPPPAGRPFAEQAAVERCEAAPAEHYARLVRVAYLVLAPSLGRNRRVLSAHWLAQRSLAARTGQVIRGTRYAHVRLRLVRSALEAGLPLLGSPCRGGRSSRRWSRRCGGCGSSRTPAGRTNSPWNRRCRAGVGALPGRLCAAGARRARRRRGLPGARGGGRGGPARRAAGGRRAHGAVHPAGLTRVRPLLPPGQADRRGPAEPARAGAPGGARRGAVCGTLLRCRGTAGGPSAASAPLYARHPPPSRPWTRARCAGWPRGSGGARSVPTSPSGPTRGDRTGDSRLLRRALAAWARPGPAVVSRRHRGRRTARRGPPAAAVRGRGRHGGRGAVPRRSARRPLRRTAQRGSGRGRGAGLRPGGRRRLGGGRRAGGAAPGPTGCAI